MLADIRPWIGWARARPVSSDLEQELPLVGEKVNHEAGALLDHIRKHPNTAERSLKGFESRLAAAATGQIGRFSRIQG
ncbi:hypothetical protein HZ994_00370 [Akkermansiaceae bacterium]|nr:hypothetical protein HZ994_00370 [Akkermansiaceae bacterium]